MLNWLREHFANTPKEIIEKNWQEIESLELQGPNASEYIYYLENYTNWSDPPQPLKNIVNDTPNYSGYFFLL